VTLLHAFCEQTKVDYYEYVPQLIRSLILLMADTDEGVLQEAWNALNAVTKTLDASKFSFCYTLKGFQLILILCEPLRKVEILVILFLKNLLVTLRYFCDFIKRYRYSFSIFEAPLINK
jgi:hypothetical protein